MTTDAFKEYVKTCRALDTEEIHRFMDDMSNEARRITFRLNTAYHTPSAKGCSSMPAVIFRIMAE